MVEKKGILGGLFGGGKKKSGCCDMVIEEVTEDAACDCGGNCGPAEEKTEVAASGDQA